MITDDTHPLPISVRTFGCGIFFSFLQKLVTRMYKGNLLQRFPVQVACFEKKQDQSLLSVRKSKCETNWSGKWTSTTAVARNLRCGASLSQEVFCSRPPKALMGVVVLLKEFLKDVFSTAALPPSNFAIHHGEKACSFAHQRRKSNWRIP